VRRATARIQDIANNLIEQSRTTKSQTAIQETLTEASLSVELLSSLIDPLVTEKRLQFRSRREVDIQAEFGESAYGLFAQVQPTEFKRVLSNLVNNAVEGIEEKGKITVELRSEKSPHSPLWQRGEWNISW